VEVSEFGLNGKEISVMRLAEKFVSPLMREVIERDLGSWDGPTRDLLVEEFLKFLIIACHSDGIFLPCSREIDTVWHTFIIETREYRELCNRIKPGRFLDHRGIEFKDYIVGKSKEEIVEESLSVLASYKKNFGDFSQSAVKHWAVAEYIVGEFKLDVAGLNSFLSELLSKVDVNDRNKSSNSDYLKKVHADSPEKKYAFFEQMICRSEINSYESCVRLMNLTGSQSVLDFGCGDGILCRYLPDSAIESYLGVDISKVSILRARKRFSCLKKAFLSVEGDGLPLGDNTFDVACAHMVLALVADVEVSLREIHRTLKPSGRLIAFTPAYWRKGVSEGSRRFEHLMDGFSKFIPGRASIIARSHPFLSREEIVDTLITSVGFSEVKTFESDFIVELRPLDALSIFTEGFYEFDRIDDSIKPDAVSFFMKSLIEIADEDGIVRFERPMEIITAQKKV